MNLHMATDKVVSELQAAIDALVEERDEIDEKIALLQETVAKLGGKSPGKGRRKKAATKKASTKKATTKKASTSKRKKPHWSPEARKAAKERMQRYWAERKKKEAGSKKKTSSKKK